MRDEIADEGEDIYIFSGDEIKWIEYGISYWWVLKKGIVWVRTINNAIHFLIRCAGLNLLYIFFLSIVTMPGPQKLGSDVFDQGWLIWEAQGDSQEKGNEALII